VENRKHEVCRPEEPPDNCGLTRKSLIICLRHGIEGSRGRGPATESLVPQGAKTGANKYWSPTTQAQITQNAAIFSGKVPLRSEGSLGSEAWMRSGLHSRARMHACAGPGLHPTGGTTEELRRIPENCALREAASVKFAR
jgi:hypothetical protein